MRKQADKRCKPPGQSRYRMVVLRRAQYRQPAESATVNPYGGRTEAAAPDAERDEEEGNASRGVSAFCRKSCRIIIIRWS